MTRFLCCGDLHLGAGTEYGREPSDRLEDQRQAWAQVLAAAEEHHVEAVLFAGDAFHRRRPSPAELLAFRGPLADFVARTGIPVYAIPGNHDIESRDLPCPLELFEPLLSFSRTPGVWDLGETMVAALPWTSPGSVSRFVDGLDIDQTSEQAVELLLAVAGDLRARCGDRPAVLLTHWSIGGARTPTGVATDEFRETVIPLDRLEALGFDATVAGHIHLPEVVNGPFDGGRPILYVGSPLPVDFGEQDSPHGYWIVDLEATTRANFYEIDSRPFVTVNVDLTTSRHEELGLDETDGIAAAIGAALPITDAVLRLRYRATEEQAQRIQWEALEPLLSDAHKVYQRHGDIVRPERARSESMSADLSPTDAVRLWCDATGEDEPTIAKITAGYLDDVVA